MTVRRWLGRRVARWAIVRLGRYLGRPEVPGPTLLDGEATAGSRLRQPEPGPCGPACGGVLCRRVCLGR